MATGNYVWRDSQYGQRLILSLSRSGNTVSWTLQLQSTGSMYATLSYAVSGSTSKSAQYTISQGGAYTQTIGSGSFTSAGAATVNASSTMHWGGTCTVSASISVIGGVLRIDRSGNDGIFRAQTKLCQSGFACFGNI